MDPQPGFEWKALLADPAVRLRVIREYAADVLGSPWAATRWLGKPHLAVRAARCTVLEACDSPAGFYEAMAELARIGQFRQREAQKRQRMHEQAAQLRAKHPWQGAVSQSGG